MSILFYSLLCYPPMATNKCSFKGVNFNELCRNFQHFKTKNGYESLTVQSLWMYTPPHTNNLVEFKTWVEPQHQKWWSLSKYWLTRSSFCGWSLYNGMEKWMRYVDNETFSTHLDSSNEMLIIWCWSLFSWASWLLSLVGGMGTVENNMSKSFIRHPSSHLLFHLLPRLLLPLLPLMSHPAHPSGRCTLDTSRQTGSLSCKKKTFHQSQCCTSNNNWINQTFYFLLTGKSGTAHKSR